MELIRRLNFGAVVAVVCIIVFLISGTESV